VKELIIASVLFVAALCAFTYGMLLLGDSRERSACYKTGLHTGYQVRYPDHLNFDEGCFIKVKDRWVPLRNWRPED
jgi:hypothetical protein